MMMKRCNNGHLYNEKKHKQCPYCDESSLNEAEDKKQDAEDSKTVSKGNGENTVAYWDNQDGINPVVGWLICIEGIERGKDYKIVSEKNFIGRSDDMHISIAGDNSISRRNHGVISYNPKQRNFILIPGAETTGIIYINDDAVYAPTDLSSYDLIEMGDSKFIFLPLCGQHFEWENEI